MAKVAGKKSPVKRSARTGARTAATKTVVRRTTVTPKSGAVGRTDRAPTKALKPVKLRYTVFDADTHVLETPTIWTRFLDKTYRTLARSTFWPFGDGVGGEVFLNGRAVPGLDRNGIPRHAVWRPGMTADNIGDLDPAARHAPNPGASDARARLKDMDAMGVTRAVIYPTLFLHYFPLIRNADVAAALARAYNDWIRDFAKADARRLVPVAVLPQQNIGQAITELRRVAKLGFKAALVTPAFHDDRYPAQRAFDPLWAAFESSGLVACVHPLAGPAVEEGDANAPFIDRIAELANVGHPVSGAIAPTMDVSVFLTAIMAEGLLETFPKLKLVLAHSGATWLPVVLEKAETYLWLSPQQHPVSLEPGQVFANRRTLVNFYSGEGAVRRLPDEYGAVAGWGSLYPTQETIGPSEAIADLEAGGVAPDIIASLMGGNTARLFI